MLVEIVFSNLFQARLHLHTWWIGLDWIGRDRMATGLGLIADLSPTTQLICFVYLRPKGYQRIDQSVEDCAGCLLAFCSWHCTRSASGGAGQALESMNPKEAARELVRWIVSSPYPLPTLLNLSAGSPKSSASPPTLSHSRSVTVAVDAVDTGDHRLSRVHDDVAPAQRRARQTRVAIGYAARLVTPDVRRIVDLDSVGNVQTQARGCVRVPNLKLSAKARWCGGSSKLPRKIELKTGDACIHVQVLELVLSGMSARRVFTDRQAREGTRTLVVRVQYFATYIGKPLRRPVLHSW